MGTFLKPKVVGLLVSQKARMDQGKKKTSCGFFYASSECG